MGKTPAALVTGASRGIGRGIALELAANGFDLLINYRSDRESAATTAQECLARASTQGHSIRAEIIQADISLAADRQKLVEQARTRFGRLHALINNAGVAPETREDLLETSEASFDRVMGINLKGQF